VFIEERVRQIERTYAHLLRDVLVLRLTDETLRLVLILSDGTTLRVTERWQAGKLLRYSYYWLDTEDKLKVGWDNSPHHHHLDNYPHHKHLGEQAARYPSYETSLENVMVIVQQALSDS